MWSMATLEVGLHVATIGAAVGGVGLANNGADDNDNDYNARMPAPRALHMSMPMSERDAVGWPDVPGRGREDSGCASDALSHHRPYLTKIIEGDMFGELVPPLAWTHCMTGEDWLRWLSSVGAWSKCWATLVEGGWGQ
jgi:hypothetical protein